MNPSELIREHLPELRDDYLVSRIGIFGSFARGEATEMSDVDILVEFRETIDIFHFIRLQDRLASILGRKNERPSPWRRNIAYVS